MSGFFKKLFNRIAGKKDEAAPPPGADTRYLADPAALPEPEPAPQPEPEPEPEAQPVVIAAEPEAAVVAEPAAEAETPQVARPPRKVAAPKVEAKKSPAKKPEPKRPEPKKPEPKKAAARKSAPAKPDAKAPAPEPQRPVADVAIPPETAEAVVAEAPQPVESAVPVETEIVAEAPAGDAAADAAPAAEAEPAPPPAPQPERRGWLSRLRDGLSKSSRSITSSIASIFTKRRLDKATLEELEDVLIQADLGLPMAERIVKAVALGRYDKEIEPAEVKRILAEEVGKVLKPVEVPFNFGSEKPFVILVVGVNGSGKTTTIGKLGAIAAAEGFKVMFAACDTFRAAAIEQLTVWGQRIGARTISRPTGADSSGLAFDAMKAARDDGADILFVDTAGRLQNKAYLMDELDKVVRVIRKQDAAAPHAVILVLDATTGQNAIAQADVFTKVAGVTGLIMTKLDGTARGGILVAIAEKFKLPVHAIGVGESIDDLQPFEAEAFARAIAGLEER